MLNTLLHEFAHHLDVHLFGWPDTPHTRGFYWRSTPSTTWPCGTTATSGKPLV